jgi:predicted SprT family Zn-dependent metalloprotease
MKGRLSNPTTQTYTSLTTVYDYFNKKLFAGSLPPSLITMQRHKGSFGYFSGERFANAQNPKDVTDEIALNPLHFANRPAEEVLATLAHEMVHLWQHHFGDKPRRGYHDRQWAGKMLTIGLTPTATGQPGGKMTGQKVTHLIDANGPFANAAAALLREHPAILYHDRAQDLDETRKKKAASKTKYTCPTCGLNAWAKPQVTLICGTCRVPLESEETE